jgi:hypothetical protein
VDTGASNEASVSADGGGGSVDTGIPGDGGQVLESGALEGGTDSSAPSDSGGPSEAGADGGPSEAGADGGPSEAGADGGSGGGPTILNLSTNVTQMTSSEQLIVTAVVTDAAGIGQVIGGTLSDPGGGTYGAFNVSTTSGAWSITLTWTAINTVTPITAGIGGQARMFVATFYDQGGHTTTKSVTVQLLCGVGDTTSSLCSGSCFDLSTDPHNCGSCGHACPGLNQYYPPVCISGTYCAGIATVNVTSPTTCASICNFTYEGYTFSCNASTTGDYGCNGSGQPGIGCASSGPAQSVTLASCNDSSPSGSSTVKCACEVQ